MRFTATRIITGYIVVVVVAGAAIIFGTDLLDSSEVKACKMVVEFFSPDPRAIEYDEVLDKQSPTKRLFEAFSDDELQQFLDLEGAIAFVLVNFYSPNDFGVPRKHWVLCGFNGKENQPRLMLLWADNERKQQTIIDNVNEIFAKEKF